ncbi:MAG: inositol 2-dehydrogenase [Spirochaetia bacterium]|nr:inositol 2-dehydrogenase [Spirochaetia bacterium]
MTKKLSIGIVGTGKIGRLHLDSVINHIPNAEVIHAADPYMPDDVKEWLQESGAIRISLDPDEVITDDAVKAIMICSPTDTHAELIVKAAKAGKHIFCEKPVDFNLQRILETMREVKKAGVKFQIGFNRRFDHNFKKMHEIVQSGKIGEPHIIKISSRDPAPPTIEYVRSSGGIFMDQMIHDFDMIRYLTGKEVQFVHSNGSVLVDEAIGKEGDVDTAVVTLGFEGGAIGIIDNSRQAVYGYDQRAEVFGSKGSCMTDNDTATRVSLITDEGVLSDKPPYFFLERYFFAYVEEMRGFVEAVLEDKEVVCDVIDAILPVVIAKAAKQSYETEKPVYLEEILPKKTIAEYLS